MSKEQKDTYKAAVKPAEDAEDLFQFRPFLHWEKATNKLFSKHKLHVMAVCAHENENGRLVSPLPVCNSGKWKEIKKGYSHFTHLLLDASLEFFREVSVKAGYSLHKRFERQVNQDRGKLNKFHLKLSRIEKSII